jgi:hypothetical protein
MSANIIPIFPAKMNVSWGTLTAANTAKDGTGSAIVIFTAGTDGSRVDEIKARPLGTNATTVLRLFINNGSDPEVAANNTLLHEVTIAETTLSEVGALADYVVTVTLGNADPICPIPHLPAGYKITATLGTAVAAGIQVTVFGGDY